ncbi:MAG: ABC transporter permease [Candidatus Bathyarchaeia archaeon]
MRLRDYVLRRLILLIPVLLGVTMIVFGISHMVGDPVAAYVSERTSEDQIKQVIRQRGLDQPLYVQYVIYLGDLLKGDWGLTRSMGDRPVTDVIREFFPATLELTMAALVMMLVIGIPLGILSATRKDKMVDHLSRIFALSGVSMPVFWLGLLLLLVFYYYFQILGLPNLPGSGRIDPFIYPPFKPITGLYLIDSILEGRLDVFLDVLAHLILPAFVLGYHGVALITRMMRSSMLEVLRQDYITLARSKGLSEKVVIYRHALKNAMIPTITVAGLAFGSLLTGSPLTETVFAWPGIGRWAAGAILTTDFSAITGFTIVAALVYVFANLIVDLVYAALDPRIRFQ